MSKFTLTIVLNIILACCGIRTTVYAAPLNDISAKEPIHIEADRMVSDQRKESVLFDGNVEATQGDMVIRADQMTVYYRKADGNTATPVSGAGKSIDNLQATGNIKIIKQDWLASGDRMEFETEGRKVVITGNTKVWQGNNTVTGDKVILYLDEGKSVVENQAKDTGNRVKAFFYPDTAETKNNKERVQE